MTFGFFLGTLIGLSVESLNGELFRGPFLDPYELLSSAFDNSSVVQITLLSGMAIGKFKLLLSISHLTGHLGLAASAPGVRVFGEESRYILQLPRFNC